MSQFNPYKSRTACVIALAAMLLFGGLQALEAGHFHSGDDTVEQCLLCKNIGDSHAAPQTAPPQLFAAATATILAVVPAMAAKTYLDLQPRAPPFHNS
ncbi:MAG: hypothetical protein ABJK20_18295 [Halieaceae bacterium]